MKNFLQRTLFVLLSTTIMVFFSEKAYWYPPGYVLGGLILFYAFPVFAALWAIERFHIQTLSALILIAAFYAFLVEGVLTPVIYEAGLIDPVMPAYFISWHGLISVVFGWYLIRRWLLRGAWGKLLTAGALFGLFWGLWSLTFWLPESVAEFEALAAQGESVLPGTWTPADFGLYALTFTLVLIGAHYLLGRGGWLPSFRPGRAEKGLVTLVLIFFFITLVALALPLAVLKLAFLLGLVTLGLRANRQNSEGSLFYDLTGPVKLKHTLTLLAMPLAATMVYAASAASDPSEDTLRLILEMTPLIQALIGGGLFLWALAVALRPQKQMAPEPEAQPGRLR